MSFHRPRKRFGQNFLEDAAVIARIISAVRPSKEDHLVEIGPGQGALTESLAGQVKRFDAIELDKDLIPQLEQRFASLSSFHLHQSDVLEFDWAQLPQDQLWRVVGNLPYNISSPLLMKLFAMSDKIRDIHVMLQKEVADRLAAKPGNKQYGRLSVIAQYHCDIQKIFEIPPEAFFPPPKVMSAVVVLRPRQTFSEQCENISALEDVTRQAFSQRRKTLANAMKALMPEVDWSGLEIDPSCRPEQITVNQFVRLANAYLRQKGD